LSFGAEAVMVFLGVRAKRLELATQPAQSVQTISGGGAEGIGRYGTVLGWLGASLLALSLVTRAMASGRGPFADMYDFSIAFAWGITLVYMVIDWRYRSRTLGLVVLPVALALMLYAASLPASIDPLVPALQNNTLLTLHVSVAILAYSCFAVSAAAAVLFLSQDRLRSRFLPEREALDEVGFLSAALGFPFMTLVLILGAYWANTAWGRYWGWDPKETASLVTWLIYTGYLHTRALRDWRGRRSAILLVLGFVAVMLTYFGNLFFGGLHGYS
jgi:cytochrome c-type biogenesis protein CcsB